MGAVGALRPRPGRDGGGRPADGRGALDRTDPGGRGCRRRVQQPRDRSGPPRKDGGRAGRFRSRGGKQPGEWQGAMERVPVVPAGVPVGAGCPDPAGRLGRDPQPRPLRLPRRGNDPRRAGCRAAAGRRRVEEPVHRAGRVVPGGEEECGPRPVLPPRSRGVGPVVSGDRAGLDGAVETSFQEDLDEQRLSFVRGQHAGRREPGVRRHLQRVPRAARQGAPRRGGARAAGVEYSAAPSVCPGLLHRVPGGGSPLGGEGVPVLAVRHPPLPFRRPVHHLVELRQAGGRLDRRHADRSLEGGARELFAVLWLAGVAWGWRSFDNLQLYHNVAGERL